ncbi:MAG: DUF1249 domain-containing protein [Pseudomonadales bacterium]|jgi:hypothetical protein
MNKRRRYVPNLIADMAECDANYIRLHRLFPHMADQDQLEFGVDANGQSGNQISSLTEDGATVTISIVERCPYTTMMLVRVASEEDKPWIRWPTLEVRVYHDIKSAEVVSFERHRNFKFRYHTPNQKMFQPDEKSQINRYFGELLTFCYEHGHSLETVDVGRA